jgi:hypothetical protein
MKSAFRCPSPSQCPVDGVHSVASLKNSESCEELKGTSDYLEAVHTMDQEDMRCLMPQPRDLHDVCSTQCVAMEIYPDSHLQGQDSDKILSITDHESKMSHQEEKEMFHLSPRSQSDKDILQRSEEESSEATTTKSLLKDNLFEAEMLPKHGDECCN